MEKGAFEFTPKYKKWDEVPKDKQVYYGLFWEQFSRCARCVINQYIQMRSTNSIHHETVGCCNPTAFYLALIDSQGKYYQWYQNVMWNGIKQRQNCIQFRFYNCLPNLDKFNDWGNFTIRHTLSDSKFGDLVSRHKMEIVYISLTCNVESTQVWCSFKFKKTLTTNISEKLKEFGFDK